MTTRTRDSLIIVSAWLVFVACMLITEPVPERHYHVERQMIDVQGDWVTKIPVVLCDTDSMEVRFTGETIEHIHSTYSDWYFEEN